MSYELQNISQTEDVSVNDTQVNKEDLSENDGFLDTIEALWNNLQGLVHDQLQLAILEIFRVGKSLAAIITCTLVIALLIASTWLCLVGALVLWFIQNGMNASIALLFAAAINIFGVLGFLIVIAQHSQRLRFPATMNTLKNARSVKRQAEINTPSATGAL